MTVSSEVPLVEKTKAVETFNLAYERLFREFQETLVSEYANTRHVYIEEYQTNFEQNSSRCDNRIADMN